jgi:beta-glucosidase
LTIDDPNIALVGSDRDRQEALEMARQSITLTKNKGKTLPIEGGKIKVLVTGPTSSSLRYQSGGWTWQWQGTTTDDDWFSYGTTVLDAAKSIDSWDTKFSCGVDILGNDCDGASNNPSGVVDTIKNWVGLGVGESASVKIAADMASSMDYVIVCIGEENYAEKPGDIETLELPIGQVELVQALAETNAKVIVVYFGGRTRLMRDLVVSLVYMYATFIRSLCLHQNLTYLGWR